MDQPGVAGGKRREAHGGQWDQVGGKCGTSYQGLVYLGNLSS